MLSAALVASFRFLIPKPAMLSLIAILEVKLSFDLLSLELFFLKRYRSLSNAPVALFWFYSKISTHFLALQAPALSLA